MTDNWDDWKVPYNPDGREDPLNMAPWRLRKCLYKKPGETWPSYCGKPTSNSEV
jgi:hypothetical protein